jgi:hypothetical protein
VKEIGYRIVKRQQLQTPTTTPTITMDNQIFLPSVQTSDGGLSR